MHSTFPPATVACAVLQALQARMDAISLQARLSDAAAQGGASRQSHPVTAPHMGAAVLATLNPNPWAGSTGATHALRGQSFDGFLGGLQAPAGGLLSEELADLEPYDKPSCQP